MPIDLDPALGAQLPSQEFSWTASDVALYALSVGAAADPTDTTGLEFVHDSAPKVLPSFATVAATMNVTEAPKVSFPGVEIDLWGPASPVQHLAERIAMYISPPLFPVHLDDVPSALTFHDAPETEVTIGSATVRAALVTHQGPTVGYRIEEEGRVLVYLPDHEPSLGHRETQG